MLIVLFGDCCGCVIQSVINHNGAEQHDNHGNWHSESPLAAGFISLQEFLKFLGRRSVFVNLSQFYLPVFRQDSGNGSRDWNRQHQAYCSHDSLYNGNRRCLVIR